MTYVSPSARFYRKGRTGAGKRQTAEEDWPEHERAGGTALPVVRCAQHVGQAPRRLRTAESGYFGNGGRFSTVKYPLLADAANTRPA